MSDEFKNNDDIFEEESAPKTGETFYAEVNDDTPIENEANQEAFKSETEKRQQQLYGQPEMQQFGPKPKSEARGYGIAAFIIGIISLCLFCSCINIPLAITGLILAIVQIATCREKAFAVAGLVMNILSIVFCFVFWGLLFTNSNLVNSVREEYKNEFQDNDDGSKSFEFKNDGDGFTFKFDDEDMSPFMKEYMEEFENGFNDGLEDGQDSPQDSLENQDGNTF